MTTQQLFLTGALAAVSLASSTATHAQTKALKTRASKTKTLKTSAFWFPKPQQGAESLSGTDGFEFRPTRDLLVLSLGYYDHGRNGLDTPHRVSLYETGSRRLLTYATIDKRGRTSGRFCYRPIHPRLLKAGTSYTVAGYHPGATSHDLAASNPSKLHIAPAIGYHDYRFNLGPAPAFPDQTGDTPFFGPGFQFR